MDRRELLSGLAATAAVSIVTPKSPAPRPRPTGRPPPAWTGASPSPTWTPTCRARRCGGCAGAPAGLSGALYRNGPGKFHRPGGSVAHWFDGDGLVRAFRIADGRATLEARFVDTPKRRADTAANAVVTSGFGTPAGPGARLRNGDDANAANISVMRVGDELWALWESGSPIALDPADLSTKGLRTLRPDRPTPRSWPIPAASRAATSGTWASRAPGRWCGGWGRTGR